MEDNVEPMCQLMELTAPLNKPYFSFLSDNSVVRYCVVNNSDNWTTGAIRRAKLQPNHHHQETNIQFFYRRALPVTHQQCRSTEGKMSHSMDLLTPSSPWGLPTLSLTTNSSLPWGLPCLSSAFWCQYPIYYWSLFLVTTTVTFVYLSVLWCCWLGDYSRKYIVYKNLF